MNSYTEKSTSILNFITAYKPQGPTLIHILFAESELLYKGNSCCVVRVDFFGNCSSRRGVAGKKTRKPPDFAAVL